MTEVKIDDSVIRQAWIVTFATYGRDDEIIPVRGHYETEEVWTSHKFDTRYFVIDEVFGDDDRKDYLRRVLGLYPGCSNDGLNSFIVLPSWSEAYTTLINSITRQIDVKQKDIRDLQERLTKINVGYDPVV